MRSGRHRLILPGIVTLLAASCNPFSLDESAPTLWEASLTATLEFPLVRGSAAAVSDPRLGRTEVGILVEGLTPQSTIRWAVYRGTCAEPGSQFGPDAAYPPAAADGDGTVETTAAMGQLLAANGRYHIAVGTVEGTPRDVACGDLQQIDAPST